MPQRHQLCFYSQGAKDGSYCLTMDLHCNLNIASWSAKPLIFTLWLFRRKFANLSIRVVVLKLQSAPESPGGLIKTRVAGWPRLQSFWFSRVQDGAWEFANLLSSQVTPKLLVFENSTTRVHTHTRSHTHDFERWTEPKGYQVCPCRYNTVASILSSLPFFKTDDQPASCIFWYILCTGLQKRLL